MLVLSGSPNADGQVRALGQARGEDAHGGGLAAAWVPGDHGEAAIGQRELDTPAEGVDGRRDEQRLQRTLSTT
jgi:hypothetical protein